MTWALLLAAFSMGFFGSPHCLGMCGGIVTAFGLSMQHVSEGKKNALILTYHVGRLLSYSLLGVVAGLVGMTLLQPMMGNNIPRVLLGAVLVLIGLSMFGLPFFNQLEKLGMKFWQVLAPIRTKVFPIDSFGKALLAGLLWGFLPCGLVYGALLMAIAGHDVLTGALMMFVFGLGTMPMLIATQKTVGLLQNRIKTLKLRQLNGILMVISGLAVVFLPMMMHSMGGHDHGSMNHASMGHTMPAAASSTATMAEMDHSQMDHSQMDHSQMDHSQMDHSQMDHSQMDHSQMDHSQMDHASAAP